MASKLETAGRQAYQGLTFGLGDELIDAPTAAIVAALTGQKYSDVLGQARQMSKENLAKDWENSPLTSLAANIVGGLPYGLAMSGRAPAVKALSGLDEASKSLKLQQIARALESSGNQLSNWASAGSRMARAAKGAAIGTGLGAGTGAATGDDTLQDRLVAALRGAALGGSTGFAGGLASHGAPTVKATAQEAAKETAQNPAEREFLRQLLMRPDLETMQGRMQDFQNLSKKTGIELTLPEMLAQTDVDPLLGQQAILTKSPETAGVAQALLQRRMGDPLAGQQGQLTTAVKNTAENLAQGSYDDLAQALINRGKKAAGEITGRLSKQAAPLYEEAFAQSVPSEGLAELSNKMPIVGNAIKTALSDERFSGQLQGKPINSVEVLDAAKRIIDEKIRAGMNPAQPFDTRAYGMARDALLEMADKAAPAYSQARNIYAGQGDALQNRVLLGNLANIDQLAPEKVIPQLYGGTVGTAQKTASALGEEGSKLAAAAKLQDILGGLKTGNLPPKIDEDTLNMLRAYAGSNANDVNDVLRMVERARAGERFLRGSQTQSNQAINKGMDQAAGVMQDLATGNKSNLVNRAIDATVDKLGLSNREQYNKDLLNLFTTDRGIQAVNEAANLQKSLMSANPSLLPVTAGAYTGNELTQMIGAVSNKPDMLPTYMVTPASTQAMQNLPAGFVVQGQDQKRKDLPEGFIIQGGN